LYLSLSLSLSLSLFLSPLSLSLSELAREERVINLEIAKWLKSLSHLYVLADANPQRFLAKEL
jgi:hypothetical protein